MEKKPHRYVVRSAKMDDPEDFEITWVLGKEMRMSGPYRNFERREDGQSEVDKQFRANMANQCLLLAFRDDEPVGMLAGSVSYLFSIGYITALCLFLYVKPAARDGKSALLLIAAFREWAEGRNADEIRFQVTSKENIEKSHEMFQALGCIYIGGNYTYPISDQGRQVYPLSERAKKVFPSVKKRRDV